MRVVVFDFDGVIIPSEEIKKKGYELIFSEYGEDVPVDAVNESRAEFANARGDRYDIIRGILLRVGVRGDIEQKVQEYAGRFNAIVRAHMNTFEVDVRVRASLESLAKKSVLYINSNTPDEPLLETIERLGIAGLFKGIYGSSLSKIDSLQAIAALEGVDRSEIMFIGDGDGDAEAAQACGCMFIGISTSSNGWTRETKQFPVVSSVAGVPDELLKVVI